MLARDERGMVMDDVAARAKNEFEQMIGASGAQFGELLQTCEETEAKAAEKSAALIKLWQRRVSSLRGRSVARDADQAMGG